ncbi:MAG TPA: hypothetical protein VN840_13095 [Streptosporangiaceae bacterium]|nr:hypothetical protein [Streptosporangiaceae bacterium]
MNATPRPLALVSGSAAGSAGPGSPLNLTGLRAVLVLLTGSPGRVMGAQNAQIWTARFLTSIELAPAHNNKDARVGIRTWARAP